MYDPGLAARLDDIMAGMLEMETTRCSAATVS